jgi:hypothetical protein
VFSLIDNESINNVLSSIKSVKKSSEDMFAKKRKTKEKWAQASIQTVIRESEEQGSVERNSYKITTRENRGDLKRAEETVKRIRDSS